ncbi:MAG TPA: hypothetical protein VK700_06745 [Steroidobacteraceae bacterium]|jgi:hypothetical protein|nr:hypothetical protein [Steroidobacteraceae bacterium]
MNLLQLKKNNHGYHVQLAPLAIHLDSLGRELPARNDDWVIQQVTDTDVVLSAPGPAPVVLKLGADHIQSFLSNPGRESPGGIRYGLLKLHVQAFIKDGQVVLVPCRFPGERVDPLPVQIIETDVDFQYPNDSGIQQRCEQGGCRLYWSKESDVSRRVNLEGWELVIERDANGVLRSFRCGREHNRMILIETRKPDLQAMTRFPYWRQQPGLVSCTVTADASALEFRFQDPTNAMGFLLRMGRDPSMFRCVMQPGRVDTVLAYPTSSIAA